MKPTILLLAAALFAGGATAASADRPDAGWMPLDQAYKTLTDAGYRDITEMEADDGRWEAEASKDGMRVDVTVDPRSGAIAAKPKRR